MATICIDASIAAKWVLVESDTETANALLADSRQSNTRMAVPLHLLAEVTSAVYRRLRDGLVTLDEAHSALASLDLIAVAPYHDVGLTRRALAIAAQLRLKYTYDAFYLALGELLDCDVWTADRVLYAAAHASFPRLRLLSEYGEDQG
jgi:predicted nucleic acid-binding protein